MRAFAERVLWGILKVIVLLGILAWFLARHMWDDDPPGNGQSLEE
jgi:hypothetical protein